jgi:hypothetical protein
LNGALCAFVGLTMTAFPNVIWRPLAGSQALAISCPCNHVLYEGTRGPGKTDAQLMAFRKGVGRGYGAFWRGAIFDREYKNLDDLIAKSYKWFPKFGDGAKFLASKSDYRWTWPTGEALLFRQVKRESDYWAYHGHELPWIGWNELCKYPTPALYDAMMSCNRSSFLPGEHSPRDKETGHVSQLLPEIPLVVFSTANPYGPGHNWVKSRFVDIAPAGRVVKTTTEVYNPRTQQREPVTKTQVRIFGSYKENRYLSPEYIAELERISDPNKRKAWLWGDWDIVAGGALDDLWGTHIVKPRFKVPAGWRLDRALDWGSTAPFSVGWWAEANGEEAEMADGSVFCPPSGTLVRFAEWYGCTEIGLNVGVKMSARAVAEGIKEREAQMRSEGWIAGPVYPGPADNAIGNVVEAEDDSIRKKMADTGVEWNDSDKSAGSRVNGLQLVRDRLEAARTGEGPALYTMDNCRAFIATLPTLPRDEDKPDDVDTESEDHVYDETRYRVLAGNNRGAASIPVAFPM